MMTPNFTLEETKDLEKACVLLSEALKKARASGKDTGNPLEPSIAAVLEERKRELLESPLFFQALFIATVDGVEEVIKRIHSLKNEIEVKDVHS